MDKGIFYLERFELKKNTIFQLTFFELRYLTISLRKTTFETHIDKVHMEGTVSQIFDIGPSSCFIKCRKLSFKNSPKSSRFFT